MDDKNPFVVCATCFLADSSPPHQDGFHETFSPAGSLIEKIFPRRDFFEKYDLIERVGQGGQGEVWKTWDYELRRFVAMKRLTKAELDSEPDLYRFLAEAQITSQLDHPGILPILDVGLDPDDRPYYTTSLVTGRTLEQVWRSSEELSLQEKVRLLAEVCDIVAFAHSKGVIHRDLKPQNILVGKFGDVRVVDWGAAYILAQDRVRFEQALGLAQWDGIETARAEQILANPISPLATQSTGQPLTIVFAPPEILAGKRDELGFPTDIYAVGVMLYDLLAGGLPYALSDGTLPDPKILREEIIRGAPVPVAHRRPATPRDLISVCEKAMAHCPTVRYQRMSELSDDLRSWLEVRPVKARNPGILLKFQKWSLRHAPAVVAGSAIIVLSSVFFFISRSLKAETNAAKQASAIRSAELAERSGRWRDALQYWSQAEKAGYNDSVQLGLARAEAWTVLDEPGRARKELSKLAARSDLGGERGRVLLMIGEDEMFTPSNAQKGMQDVLKAIASGLAGDDNAYAKGLLAPSSAEALRYFQEAIFLNPYHHDAHVALLGLEFLLGQYEPLQSECRIFRTLYPDDPSPVILDAFELAAQNRLHDAQLRLKTIGSGTGTEAMERAGLVCKKLAAAAAYYDVNRFLSPRPVDSSLYLPEIDPFALSSDLFAVSATEPGARIPQLPCIKDGLLESLNGVRLLISPFMSNPDAAVRKIRNGWAHHAESLLPLIAGLALDRYKTDKDNSSLIAPLQSELFQMAADSTSMLPALPRAARYLAAKTQFDLAKANPTSQQAAAKNCLINARRACEDHDTSAEELAAYYDFAFALRDFDLARQLLVKSEALGVSGTTLTQKRIELEVAVGALDSARERIEDILTRHPEDAWALREKDILSEKIQAMAQPAR